MSDRQLRTTTAPTTTTLAKRTRKASATADNDAQQRERKRALDRKAQRASREKTRTHIANLERMVQILSEKNGNAATSELLEEMGRMQAEIERLRKIIDSIKGLLGVDVVDMAGTVGVQVAPRRTSQSPQSPDQDTRSSHSNSHHSPPPPNNEQQNDSTLESVLCQIHSPNAQPAIEVDRGHHWSMIVEDDGFNRPDEYADGDHADNEQEEHMEETTQTDTDVSHTNLDWMDSIEVGSVALMGRHNNSRQPSLQHTPFWDLPSPIKTKLDPPSPEYAPCKIWIKANAIYANIFKYNRQQVNGDKTEVGSLVKFVKEGWDKLSLQERTDPILHILKEVDNHLFWDLDPVTKIANLYKSLLLLKYYFNAEAHNLEEMPLWQRPVHSQKVRRHPIPIDFFPWPALRDRLVRYHYHYFSTSEFSIEYRTRFKFNWPYTFHETYVYDAISQTYQLSPLFERYHRDMKCWSLEQSFFDKFPELAGEISMHVDGVDNLPGDIGMELDSVMDGTFNGVVHSQPNVPDPSFTIDGYGFADQGVMNLFDEYPPT